MTSTIEFSKEQLFDLYCKKDFTTFQIAAKLGCCQATIWKKLKSFNIKTRLAGVERINLTKKELGDYYLNKKLSTWKIEEKTGIPRGTIHRKLKEFSIKRRDRAEAQIIYPRKDFSGDLIEKSYLIGFRIGDLGVRKQYLNSKTICIASGSTLKEQIDLIKSLFYKYGHVWIKRTKDNKINIQVFLNESFNFLLSKELPQEIGKDRRTFFSFLGGFTDAEGSIIRNNNTYYYSLGNYDNKILFKIYKALNKFGIKCNEPKSDNRKGTYNNQGYKYNSNYWSLRVYNKSNLLELLIQLKPYIKHLSKIKALNRTIANIKLRNKLKEIKK